MKINTMKEGFTCRMLMLVLMTGLIFSQMISSVQAKSKRGWLGVRVVEITPSMRDDFSLGDRFGLLIVDVERESPADDAGLREDDVIISFDEKAYEQVTSFTRAVRATQPGTTVKLKIVRDGRDRELQADIGRQRRQHLGSMSWGPHDFSFGFGGPRLGVHVVALNDDLAEYFDGKAAGGILITEVLEDTPAEEAGLKAGDVITRVDDLDVSEPDELIEALNEYDEGEEVTIEFVRKGKTETVAVTLEDDGDFYFGRFELPYHGLRNFGAGWRGPHRGHGIRIRSPRRKSI